MTQLPIFEKTIEIFSLDDKLNSVIIGYEKRNYKSFKTLILNLMASPRVFRILGKKDFKIYSSNVKNALKSVEKLSKSAENILEILEKNILSDYRKMVDISEDYEKDGRRFESVIKKFCNLMENIDESFLVITKIMCIIVDSSNNGTKASVDISDNIDEIENENKSISVYDMKNVSGSEELLGILSKFNV